MSFFNLYELMSPSQFHDFYGSGQSREKEIIVTEQAKNMDGHTADLYVAMIKAVSKIEASGKLSLDDVENISLKTWVWLQEEELKREEEKEVE